MPTPFASLAPPSLKFYTQTRATCQLIEYLCTNSKPCAQDISECWCWHCSLAPRVGLTRPCLTASRLFLKRGWVSRWQVSSLPIKCLTGQGFLLPRIELLQRQHSFHLVLQLPLVHLLCRPGLPERVNRLVLLLGPLKQVSRRANLRHNHVVHRLPVAPVAQQRAPEHRP